MRQLADRYCAKILLYRNQHHPEEVIYYRFALPMRLIDKYRWYFDYLAARVKVKNPRRKVEVIICYQDGLCGQEYIDKKRADLLRAKRGKLNSLMKRPITDDLFGFSRQERDKKAEKYRQDIEALERGEITFWVPPTYINKIKKYL